jgi:hypothetical protein
VPPGCFPAEDRSPATASFGCAKKHPNPTHLLIDGTGHRIWNAMHVPDAWDGRELLDWQRAVSSRLTVQEKCHSTACRRSHPSIPTSTRRSVLVFSKLTAMPQIILELPGGRILGMSGDESLESSKTSAKPLDGNACCPMAESIRVSCSHVDPVGRIRSLCRTGTTLHHHSQAEHPTLALLTFR